MALFARFTTTIRWLFGTYKDETSRERDIESRQKAPSSIKDVSYKSLSKKQVEEKLDELQASI
jgi:hypothetical protein